MGGKLGWSFDGWVVAVTMARGAGTLELQLFEDAYPESCTDVRRTRYSTCNEINASRYRFHDEPSSKNATANAR